MKQGLIALLMLSLTTLVSNAWSESQPNQEELNNQMQQAATQWGEAMSGLGNAMAQAFGGQGTANADTQTGGTAIEAVNFRELKKLLKPQLGTLSLDRASGESNKAMGINVSFAEGEYTDSQSGNRVTVKITDMGSMSGFGAMANSMWVNMDIDRENADGSTERTLEWNGRKAYEEVRASGWAKVATLAGEGRFNVELSGKVEDVKVLYSAIEDLEMNRLDAMQTAAVTP